MEAEVIEFFPDNPPNPDFKLSGTLSIRIPALKQVIRGYFVAQRHNGTKWYTNSPSYKATDKSGKRVRYPIIVFENKLDNAAFCKHVRKKAQIFMENYIKQKDQPAELEPIVRKARSAPMDFSTPPLMKFKRRH